MAALAKALERLPPAGPEPARLQRQMVNIAERRTHLVSIIRRSGHVSFVRLIADCKTRLEAVITFMAILDLLKSEDVYADQQDAFGDIVLTPGKGRPANAEAGIA
jgi:segregation and condensation protein A